MNICTQTLSTHHKHLAELAHAQTELLLVEDRLQAAGCTCPGPASSPQRKRLRVPTGVRDSAAASPRAASLRLQGPLTANAGL